MDIYNGRKYPHHHPSHTYASPFRVPATPYPPVDASRFMQSASGMAVLLSDAAILSRNISQSAQFAKQLMIYAQNAKTDLVKSMIKKAGIASSFDVQYSPDGLRVLFASECCRLTAVYRW
ncbi:hypothetical protein [Metabacillus sp. RGM 3146]|uniref:hypothetical protein n=1 Tax=Metabacillus sp. RGM 3146 TaxID=3401092 RepID=UPI003B9B686F